MVGRLNFLVFIEQATQFLSIIINKLAFNVWQQVLNKQSHLLSPLIGKSFCSQIALKVSRPVAYRHEEDLWPAASSLFSSWVASSPASPLLENFPLLSTPGGSWPGHGMTVWAALPCRWMFRLAGLDWGPGCTGDLLISLASVSGSRFLLDGGALAVPFYPTWPLEPWVAVCYH